MDKDQLEAVRFLRLAANRSRGSLTATDFNDQAGPTRQTVCRRLDCSWNDAKRLAGLGITREVNVPPEKLRADVKRVADELGKKPSYQDYLLHGEYSPGPITRRIGGGSWNDGLEALGLIPQWEQDVDESRMRRDLRGLGMALGRTPASKEYDAFGRYARDVVSQRVGDGTWGTACNAVGLDPNKYSQEHVDSDLADVKRVAELYEDRWTTPELAERYNCNPNSVSWRLKGHGVDMREPGCSSVYCELINAWVGSKTERDFVCGLDNAGMLDEAKYHPDAIENAGGRWEPDFEVNGWLVECKQGTWGGIYQQKEIMEICDKPILVYGLSKDISALPHDRAITRVPGTVPNLIRVLE